MPILPESTPSRVGRFLATLCLVSLSIGVLSACSSEDPVATGGGASPPETYRFFSFPEDGRLYAATGCRTITPDAENHPGPMYMGGTDGNRIAEGTHDDLEACALLLGQDEDTLVLLALDLVGVLQPRARLMRERLAARGVDPDRILVHATHTHTGPDTLGMFGPSDLETGLDRTYQDWLVGAVDRLFEDVAPHMQPVTATFVTGSVAVEGSNHPSLIRDSRQPRVVDDRVHAVRFDGVRGGTVATLVNFPNHPETAIEYDWFSADYARHLRERLEREYGGGAIYFSGALGGLMTPIGVSVPARNAAGNPVTEDGEPVWQTETSWERTRSYGYVLAETVIGLFRGATPSPVDGIEVHTAEFPVPITNLELRLAVEFGVVEDMEIVQGPDCGLLAGAFGCGLARVWLVTFGEAQITTSPGETFPETLLGREQVTVEYGSPWGDRIFEPMEGVLDHAVRPMTMHFDLTGNSIGYIVPENDYLPNDHPDWYCEYFSVSRSGETRLRQALIELLDARAAGAR